MAERPDENPGPASTTSPGAGPAQDGGFECRRHLLRQPSRRGSGLRRAAAAFAGLVASLVVATAVVAAYGFVRLRQGPIAFDLRPQILAALDGRVGHGYRFDLGTTAIAVTDDGPALTLDRLSITDAASRPVVTAPSAAVAVDPLALLVGRVAPTRLDIHDVAIRLVILPDGQVAVSAGDGDAAAVPLSSAFARVQGAAPATLPASEPATPGPEAGSPAPFAPAPNAALRAMAAAMRSLVDATTAADGPLTALQRVNATGSLVLDDRARNAKTTFKAAVLSFDRASDGAVVLTVAADGPAGRWSLSARAHAEADGAKSLTVQARNLSLDEITLAGGLHDVGVDFDMPVSARVAVSLGSNGEIDGVTGGFTLGAGYFRLDDPDHEPVLLDGVTGGFHLDAARKSIAIDRTELHVQGGTDFVVTGRVDLPREGADPWAIHLDASGQFGAERPGERPILISRAGADARLFPAARRLVVDRAEASGPEVDAVDTAEVTIDGQGPRIRNVTSVRHMPAQVVLRLWPSLMAAPVRAWLLANVRGGMVESGTSATDLDANDLAMIKAERPVADSHLKVTFSVSNVQLGFMAGVPPLSELDASGVLTGHTFDLAARRGALELAPGRRLNLSDGSFRIPDNDPRQVPTFIQARVAGAADVLADLLSRDALKPFASLPLDPGTVRGQFDGRLNLGLRIGKDMPADDVRIAAEATTSGLAIDKLFGKEGLSDGALRIDLDRGALHVKGEGRILGSPAQIELRKPAAGAGEAGATTAVVTTVVVTTALDDAARARAGMASGGALKGIVGARITATLTPGERPRAALDLDFTRAAIEGLVPGYSKPPGRPGRATLTVTTRPDGVTALDDIAFEGGGASFRGTAEMAKDGDLASAHLTQVRLSPGDDLKIDLQQAGDVMKVTARGANLDARPFLKWLSGPGAAEGGKADAGAKGALDLELRSGVLTGQNSQAVTGADLRLSRRGGKVVRVSMSGRLGRKPLSITTAQIDNAPHYIVDVGDAGAGLLFLDLYKRMAGGRLDANLVMLGTRLDGYVAVHDFTLREDPALRKLAAEGLASRRRDTGEAEAPVDPSAMAFRKLEAFFSKTGSIVDVRDGSMFGPALGATVVGRIDFARDQVNLSGTFVPLFGVNNLFAQVPVLGPLLGGGRHEGLVGLSYRITGSAANPVLNVNPLSVLAPGFLRQIFGALDPSVQGAVPRDRALGPGAAATGQE